MDVCDTFNKLSIDNCKSILSIDIGLKHLGLVKSLVNSCFEFVNNSIEIYLIDITEYKHDKIPESDCKLYHTKTIFDWIIHMIQENHDLFHNSDYILIERQPPQGFVCIEQILFGLFREKAILISPVSVHKFHNFKDLDYDSRKIASEIISRDFLNKKMNLILNDMERYHDISDSIIQMIYWCSKKSSEINNEKLIEINEKKRLNYFKNPTHQNTLEFLETYRYNNKKIF